jgi:hypothetical protein
LEARMTYILRKMKMAKLTYVFRMVWQYYRRYVKKYFLVIH